MAITLAVLGIHLLIAPGLSLGVDEAHYALYGLRPDWSYFDHPPLIGWLQWLALQLGDTELILRLWPMLLQALAGLLVYRLGRKLFPTVHWLPLAALILFHSMPIVQLLSFGLVPEWPLLILTLLYADRLWAIHQTNRTQDWLLLGVILGLAGLTKYTAILLPVGLLIFMALNKHWYWLRQSGPWLAALTALLLITPVIYWNFQHEWISFDYQFNHATGDSWRLSAFLRGVLIQIACYGPLMLIGGIVSCRLVIDKSIKTLLLTTAFPVLATVIIATGNNQSLPHWSLVGWALLTPLVAYWLCTSWPNKRIYLMTELCGLYSLVVTGFIIVLMVAAMNQMTISKVAVKDLIGWKEAASRAEALLEQLPANDHDPVLLVSNWSHASRIAWYARPTPVQVISRRTSQFDLWFGKPHNERPGILIRVNEKQPSQQIEKIPGLVCTWASSYQARMNTTLVNHFRFYRCQPSRP